MLKFLLSFFTDKKKPKCTHFKSAGEARPDNMIDVIRFGDSVRDKDAFGVSECCVCGKRAFLCLYYHCLSPDLVQEIDRFIRREIEIEDLVAALEKYGLFYNVCEEKLEVLR